MFRDVTIRLDDDCIALFQDAAVRSGITLSAFLQNAGLLYLLKNDGQSITTALPGPIDPACDPGVPLTRKKPAFTPQKTEVIFNAFIDYLNAEMRKYRETEFRCKYSVNQKNWASWLDPVLATGESMESNHSMRELLSRKLLLAMDAGDEALCFEVVRIAMDWGGVYFSRGVRKGNRALVERLYREHELLDTLRRNYTHIKNRDIELLDFFSSGWSIVWCLMDSDYLMIVSSRKVYALNKTLLAFQQERGYDGIPACIDLGQLVYQGNPRYLDGIRYIYTKQGKLTLLKKCVRLFSAIKERGEFTTNTELDDLLYLMGE